MNSLTLPIKNGSDYERRDGKIATAGSGSSADSAKLIINSPFGAYFVYRDTGRTDQANVNYADLVADFVEIPKAHVHASSMLLYAQDAAEINKPWLRWEWRHPLTRAETCEWSALLSCCIWSDFCEYRRKPAPPVYVSINGVNVPQPMQVAPEKWTQYFFPNLTVIDEHFGNCLWENDQFDQALLNSGICHATKESAEIHASALLSFTKLKP